MKREFSTKFICFLGDCLYRDLIEHTTDELIKKLHDSNGECEKEWSELIDSTKASFPEDYAFYKFLEENDLEDRTGDDVIGSLIDAAYFVAHWKRVKHAKDTDFKVKH